MKLYMAFKDVSSDSPTNELPDKHSIMEKAIKLYSKLTKKGKTHRSVLDRHGGDLRDIQKAFPLIADRNSVTNENTHIKVEMIGKLLDKMYSI